MTNQQTKVLRRQYPKRQSAAAAFVVGALATLSAGPSLAGRPLTVDDAGVNEAGAGHVEMWAERQAGNTNMLTVAPAYGLTDGIEIALAFVRDTSSAVSSTAAQIKLRLTPSLQSGCNMAATLGSTQFNNGAANAPFVNGIVTCNAGFGSLHVNVGAVRAADSQTLGTWGVAVERGFGAFTAHLETFGQEQAAPTVQMGLRTDIAKNVQWDATLGRVSSETVLSMGVKFQF